MTEENKYEKMALELKIVPLGLTTRYGHSKLYGFRPQNLIDFANLVIKDYIENTLIPGCCPNNVDK